MVWYPMAIHQVNLGQRVIQFPLGVSACFKRNIWGYVAHMYDVCCQCMSSLFYIMGTY